MALTPADFNPTVAGFNEWLTEASIMHEDSKAWNGTVPWSKVPWMMYYKARLTPEQALISASCRQTTQDARQHIANAQALRLRAQSESTESTI